MSATADRPTWQEVLQWDVRSWARVVPFWRTELEAQHPRNALALGEREGGLSLWLAAQGIGVTCTDLHDFPPETARLHQRYGVQDRIRYARVDAMDIPYPEASFDLVVFKSMIGALGSAEAQRKAIGEMHRVLRPGGLLLFAENLSGTAVHRALRKRFIPWDHYWRYLRWPADEALFKDFPERRFMRTGLWANLGRSEAQRTFLSRLDDMLLPITPGGWRYILAGCCRKAR